MVFNPKVKIENSYLPLIFVEGSIPLAYRIKLNFDGGNFSVYPVYEFFVFESFHLSKAREPLSCRGGGYRV